MGHLHFLVTDGGFRLDGTFASWPAQDTARLTEAFRRAVLRVFVRLEVVDVDQAADTLAQVYFDARAARLLAAARDVMEHLRTRFVADGAPFERRP